jgi:hypothetical protein
VPQRDERRRQAGGRLRLRQCVAELGEGHAAHGGIIAALQSAGRFAKLAACAPGPQSRTSRVGLLSSVGFKFGRWVDSVLMQRPLGEGDATLPVERG